MLRLVVRTVNVAGVVAAVVVVVVVVAALRLTFLGCQEGFSKDCLSFLSLF